MNSKSIMLIAGEASGDMLAAELVKALRVASPSSMEFLGAGGPKMAEAGVELAFDLTQHSTIGISWVKKYFELRGLFHQLVKLAIDRKPDVIVGVDYNLFNLRFAEAIKEHIRKNGGPANHWNPKIVKYVSPQVWASRPSRAEKMARDFDLLLSIFPFERNWYAKRVPNLRVEFVGHPMIDRYSEQQNVEGNSPKAWVEIGDASRTCSKTENSDRPWVRFSQNGYQIPDDLRKKKLILLLPGSRTSELNRHLPPLLSAAENISDIFPSCFFRIVLPDERLIDRVAGYELVEHLCEKKKILEIHAGGLAQSLSQATLAIASTGTVTMECAFFGVPTIAIYKTSSITYQLGKRIVQVKYLAMPNLLANEPIFPEFIQHEATAENISREAITLLNSNERQAKIKMKLSKVIESLGETGASERAARAILNL